MKRTLAVLALASFGLMAAPKPPKTGGTTDTTHVTSTQTTTKHKAKKHAAKPGTEKPAETTPNVQK